MSSEKDPKVQAAIALEEVRLAVRSVVDAEEATCATDVVPSVLAAIAHEPRRNAARGRVWAGAAFVAAAAGAVFWFQTSRAPQGGAALPLGAGHLAGGQPVGAVPLGAASGPAAGQAFAAPGPLYAASIESVEFFDAQGIIIQADDLGAALVWQNDPGPAE